MKNNILTILCLVSLIVTGNAQTVNTGDLVVSPGTILSTVSDFDNTPTGALINDGEFYVYANWNNDGMIDFLGDTGITNFIGFAVQRIAGTNISYLYDVLFINASAQPAFELSGDLSITNQSTFSDGIVDNDNFGGTIIFEQNADHNQTSDQSHVDGPVVKVGDQGFRYPIGDSQYYRFAEISAPGFASDEFTGKYFFEDTNTNYPTNSIADGSHLILIDNAEHWTIERTAGNNDVLVTLSWDEATTPAEILAAPTDAIHIARWDEDLNVWVDEGGVVNESEKIVTTAVNKYGVFTLARIDDSEVLPCALTIKNLVTPNNDNINDYFEVEQAVNSAACARNMKVTIFNRWGVKVYEEENYDTTNSKFGGFSDGRATINRNEKLPSGTYFYILTFDYDANNSETKTYKKAGYLYINDN